MKKLNNKAIIFVIQRNAEKYLHKCMSSVVSQDYCALGIIFIDDASTDDSVRIAREVVGDRENVSFIVNKNQSPKILSIKKAISEYCENPDSVLFWVDGDDYLLSSTAVSEMMKFHNVHDVVWSQHVHQNGNKGCSARIRHKNIRKHKWVSSALRSFKKFLFDAIDVSSFESYSGKYLEKTVDQAMMYPMLEMAGDKRRYFYNKVLYFYTENPKAMSSGKGLREQVMNEQIIRRKQPYKVYPKIAMFGNISEKNNQKELLTILSPWKDKVCAYLVGEVEDQNYLNEIRSNTQCRIIISSMNEAEDILKGFDAIIQTEEAGVSAEYLLGLGVPIIAKDRIYPEIVHMKNGFVYEHCSWAAQWIINLYDDPALVRRIAQGRSPSVSVVVPCYNQSHFLDRCIGSITEQTLKSVEIIIINDGGNDNCKEVVEKIQKQYPSYFIKYIEQENQGVGEARNVGFREAIADFVLPLDADDYIRPEMLKLCLKKAKKDSADVVYTDFWSTEADAKIIANFDVSEILRQNMLVCTCLIKKEMWQKCGGYDSELKKIAQGYEDWDLWISCIKNRAKFSKVPGDHFVYDNCHGLSMIKGAQKNHKKLLREIRKKHKDFYETLKKINVKSEEPKPPIDITPKIEKTDAFDLVEGLTLVVSSYNQRDNLEMAFESYRHQDLFPVEIIVGDDGSSDETIEWIDSLGAGEYPFKISYVTRKHEWYRLASINNLAAINVVTSRILFTNGDQIHNPESFRSHMSLSEDVVGGGIIRGINMDGVKLVEIENIKNFKEMEKLADEFQSVKNNLGYIANTDPNVNPIGVWGGNFSISTKMFRSVSGYDEGFDTGWGGEENDLVKRSVRAGGKVEWVKKSVSLHFDHPYKAYAYSQFGTKKYLSQP